MSQLCLIYNFAPLYREAIFRLIDGEWDCEWWFGRNTTDIKGIPENSLKKVTYIDNRRIVGQIVWQQGVGKLVRRKDLTTFLMLGEPMILSTWWVMLQRRLFFRNKRVYLWTHGWYGREGFAKKWLKRIYFGLADHVFTYGQYAKNVAVAQGFPESKITPIHNSLDHEFQVSLRNKMELSGVYKEHFGNNNPTLIFIGRLIKSKRLDILLNAIANLKSQGREFNLVLIGNGEERDSLTTLARELHLEKTVWFYGECYDDNQNASLIYNADLCVSPGNVGLTALHSMVFGTPVLTHEDFRYQGPEFEIIEPGKTGAFFKRDDVNSLADGISQWFAEHKNREEVRQACFNAVDNAWTPEYQLQVLKSNMTVRVN